MDQTALLLLLAAAMLPQDSARQTTVSRDETPPPAFCKTVDGLKPQLAALQLANPSALSYGDQDVLRRIAEVCASAKPTTPVREKAAEPTPRRHHPKGVKHKRR